MKHFIFAVLMFCSAQSAFGSNSYYEKALALYEGAEAADPAILDGERKFSGHCVRDFAPNKLKEIFVCLKPLLDDPILGEGIVFEPLEESGFVCGAEANTNAPIIMGRQPNGHIGLTSSNEFEQRENWLRYSAEKKTWIYYGSLAARDHKSGILCYFKGAE